MNESLVNITVVAACLLVWLVALVVGIRRVRHGRDRRGILLALVLLLLLVGGGLAYVRYVAPPTAFGIRDEPRIKGTPATIVTTWTGRGELRYRAGGYAFTARTDNGRYAVQAGTLQLESFTARTGSVPNEWEARTTLHDMRPLSLAPGQEYPLQVGPPFTARVEQERQLKRLALKVKDVGGHDTSISDTARKSPPGLEVLDKRGKPVWSSKFAYG